MIKRNPICGCGEEATCNEAELDCDPCCRCIPQRLCVVVEGCDCDSDLLLVLDEHGEYSGEFLCDGQVIDLLVLLHHADNVCYWRVVSEAVYLDQLFEIDGYSQTCDDPYLEIEIPLYGCTAMVVIQKHELVRLPPRLTEECGVIPFCGDCDCTCKELCVDVFKKACKDTLIVPLEEFYELDDDTIRWSGSACDVSFSITLRPNEYTGACELLIEASSYTGDYETVVEVDDCQDIEGSVTFADGYDDEVTIKYRCLECGTCELEARCPCCPPGTNNVSAPMQGSVVCTFDPNGCTPPPQFPYLGLLNFQDCLGEGSVNPSRTPGFNYASLKIWCVEDPATGESQFVAASDHGFASAPTAAEVLAATPGSYLAAPHNTWWRWESISIDCPQCPDIPGYMSAYSGLNYLYCPGPPYGPDPEGGRNFGIYMNCVIDAFGTAGC